MKILQVHNYYTNPTGDDAVVQEEYDLLVRHGHEVIQFTKSNVILQEAGFMTKLGIATSLKSSGSVGLEFKSFLTRHKPEIVHVHNIYPLITPVVFEICKEQNIPVVQTLHNYRLLCVNTLFYRQGQICEDCMTKGLNEGVKHKCYNNSRLQSYLMASSLKYHRKLDSWNRNVDAFICLSVFAKTKFIKGGIHKNKLFIKPNFVAATAATIEYQNFWFYAGKLEQQKGLDDFLEIVQESPNENFKVAGFVHDSTIFANLPNVEYLGQLTREGVMRYMAKCKGLLFLSRMYEGMPMTIIEAYAHKKLVLARNIGAMTEMVKDDYSGTLFNEVEELKEKLIAYNDMEKCKQQGLYAHGLYKDNYSEGKALKNLLSIYNLAISE